MVLPAVAVTAQLASGLQSDSQWSSARQTTTIVLMKQNRMSRKADQCNHLDLQDHGVATLAAHLGTSGRADFREDHRTWEANSAVRRRTTAVRVPLTGRRVQKSANSADYPDCSAIRERSRVASQPWLGILSEWRVGLGGLDSRNPIADGPNLIGVEGPPCGRPRVST